MHRLVFCFLSLFFIDFIACTSSVKSEEKLVPSDHYKIKTGPSLNHWSYQKTDGHLGNDKAYIATTGTLPVVAGRKRGILVGLVLVHDKSSGVSLVFFDQRTSWYCHDICDLTVTSDSGTKLILNATKHHDQSGSLVILQPNLLVSVLRNSQKLSIAGSVIDGDETSLEFDTTDLKFPTPAFEDFDHSDVKPWAYSTSLGDDGQTVQSATLISTPHRQDDPVTGQLNFIEHDKAHTDVEFSLNDTTIDCIPGTECQVFVRFDNDPLFKPKVIALNQRTIRFDNPSEFIMRAKKAYQTIVELRFGKDKPMFGGLAFKTEGLQWPVPTTHN